MRADSIALLVAMGGVATALNRGVPEERSAPTPTAPPEPAISLDPVPLGVTLVTLGRGTVVPINQRTHASKTSTRCTKCTKATATTTQMAKTLERRPDSSVLDKTRLWTFAPRPDMAAATPTAMTTPAYSVKCAHHACVKMHDNAMVMEPIPTLDAAVAVAGPEAEAVQMGFTIDAAARQKSAAGVAIVAAALAGVILL